MADDTVYRFVFEDEASSAAPPVRPGQAEGARRREQADRGPRPGSGTGNDPRRNPNPPREAGGPKSENENALHKLGEGFKKFEQAARSLEDLARGRVNSGTFRAAGDFIGRNVPRAGFRPPQIPGVGGGGGVRPPAAVTPGGVGAPPTVPGGAAAAEGEAAAVAGGEAGALRAGLAAAGPALIAVGVTAAALTVTFGMANKKAKEFAEGLAGYSATIANAKAQADIRKLRQDIENAKIVGQAVAARTASEARADAANSKSGAIIEKRLLEISQFAYDLKAWASEGSAAIVSKLDEGISTLMKVAEELPIIGDRIKKAHDEDKAATEKAAAMTGSLDVLFQDIPDIDISDAGSPGANLERQNVAFSAFGGEQRELP